MSDTTNPPEQPSTIPPTDETVQANSEPTTIVAVNLPVLTKPETRTALVRIEATTGVSLPSLPETSTEPLPPTKQITTNTNTETTATSRPTLEVEKQSTKAQKTTVIPPPLTPEQLVAKRRTEKLKALWWERFLGVLRLALLAAIGYGIYWLAQQPFWLIAPQQVHFKGTDILSSRALLPPIEKELNRPLYTLQPQAIEAKLQKQYPLIAAVQIRRRLFPMGLDVQINEHRPWALIYPPTQKASVLQYYRNVFLPLHRSRNNATTTVGKVSFPQQAMPLPYAFVLETYQSMRFNGQQFTLSPTVLAPDSLMVFTDTTWFRKLPTSRRVLFLKDMDRLLNGVRALPGVGVEALMYQPQGDMLQLELHLAQQPTQPITVLLGRWDTGLFDRAMRLKPLVRGLAFVQEAITPVEKTVAYAPKPSCYKQFDFRWGPNVTVELCNTLKVNQPTLDEHHPDALVVEEDELTTPEASVTVPLKTPER
jgi:cell division septal protein FtsQ